MSFLFKNYSLAKAIPVDYKTRFFLLNTNNAYRHGINKQSTHTLNTQRKITLERVS